MTLRGCLWDERVTSSRRPEEPPGGDVSLRCPSCGHPNRADRRYCAACGGHLGQACPSCGTRNNPEEKFCGACGAGLTEAAAEGERRQLTILFCDLVGSTAIAGQLDPEDWREIAAEYQRAAAETVARFGGHVAKYLGDGLFVYFGYAHAHEDDPERAVRGGLALLEPSPSDPRYGRGAGAASCSASCSASSARAPPGSRMPRDQRGVGRSLPVMVTSTPRDPPASVAMTGSPGPKGMPLEKMTCAFWRVLNWPSKRSLLGMSIVSSSSTEQRVRCESPR